VHLLAQLLSQLHLNPCTLICTVVQKFCFCCQTCDWWPCRWSVRGHHSHTRNITLTLLGWLAATKWQLPAYHHTLTHNMQPLDVAFMKSFKTYAQETKCGYRLIRDIVRDVYYALPMCGSWENLVSLSLPSYQSEQFLKHWDLSFLAHCLQRSRFCLELQRHWVYPSILQEQANSFVLPTDLLLGQISEASAHPAHNFLRMFCLLGDQISALIMHWESVCENC